MATFKAGKKQPISHGEMHTDITFSTSGQISGVTRTFSKKKLWGFTGSVQVVLYSKDGTVAYVTNKYSYGVNGTQIKTGPSDRTDFWSENIPAAVASKITDYYILQTHDPKLRHLQLLEEIKKGVKAAAVAYEELKPFLQKFA